MPFITEEESTNAKLSDPDTPMEEFIKIREKQKKRKNEHDNINK